MKFLKKVRRFVLRIIPPQFQAALDYFRPEMRDVLTEPFNGQKFRQQMFMDILGTIPFDAIVETGAFHGSTTQFLANTSRLPVYAVEINPRYFHFARRQLKDCHNVHLYLGDSRSFLKQLKENSEFPNQHVFFYLDAHWYKDLPLRDEVALIAANWKSAVIMIDDFEVPNDPGYGYDEYGPDKKFSLEYLSPLSDFGYVAYFPSASSDQESGWKMGCVVLVDSKLSGQFNRIPSLKPHAAPDLV
jgi:hypothetical protein